MAQDARGIAEAWTEVVAHLGIQIDAERLHAAAAALGREPAAAWAEARRQLVAAGAPAHVVRRALFALFGVVTDRDPAVAEQAAPALALLAGAPSLAALSGRRGGLDLVERVHDGPLQDAIALQLQVREDPALRDLHEALSALVNSLRNVIADVHPRRDTALEAQLAAAARRCHWADVTLSCALPADLGEDVADLVLRVVQESLANLRHAGARTARVSVGAVDGELRVDVEDDGEGFDARNAFLSRPGHLGLAWLRDIVATAGGELHVRSAPGLGSRITATFPLSARLVARARLTDSLTA